MPNFKNGPVESPDYGEEANQFSQVTEFATDVYVYGKLYADIEAGAIDFSGADNLTFNGITFLFQDYPHLLVQWIWNT